MVVFTGQASFTGPSSLTVTAGDDVLELSADTILINTGSVPIIADIAGAEIGGTIYTSTTLQHAPLPEHLIVVGGGHIGLEFASMFAMYGSEVTVLDKNSRPLPHEDEDVAGEVVHGPQGSGVRIVSDANVHRIDQFEDCVTIQYVWNDQEQQVRGDAVLLALGRTPATEGLNLEAAGIDTTDRGAIKVDEYLRTNVEGIYALGDVNGGPQFTYISLDNNRIVTDQLLGAGKRSTQDRVAIPTTLFTTPPLSRVGITESEARARGLNIKVAVKKVADIVTIPRPKIIGDPRGIIKFVVDAETDLVLGAALHHVDSHEVINLIALAMRNNVTSTELKNSIFTHPSSTEALNEVLGMV